MKRITATEAIKQLERAIKNNDRRAMLYLIAPDDPDSMPDWDDESDLLFKSWEKQVDKAMEILNT